MKEGSFAYYSILVLKILTLLFIIKAICIITGQNLYIPVADEIWFYFSKFLFTIGNYGGLIPVKP